MDRENQLGDVRAVERLGYTQNDFLDSPVKVQML